MGVGEMALVSDFSVLLCPALREVVVRLSVWAAWPPRAGMPNYKEVRVPRLSLNIQQ